MEFGDKTLPLTRVFFGKIRSFELARMQISSVVLFVGPNVKLSLISKAQLGFIQRIFSSLPQIPCYCFQLHFSIAVNFFNDLEYLHYYKTRSSLQM